jgi:hypothetical protein
MTAEPDARFAALLTTFASDRELAPIVAAFRAAQNAGRPRRFGSNGLKVGGKLFALSVRGQLVVKLPADRVAALVADGKGEPFETAPGRKMKGWLVLSPRSRCWETLAREAYAFVKGG